MSFLRDFMAGRTHKLARDFLLSGFVIICLSMAGMVTLSRALDELRVAQRQALPPRIQVTDNQGNGRITTIVRSVLDDPVTTGSIGGRSIILDPCTGKEKK
jgi:hypothetical protein